MDWYVPSERVGKNDDQSASRDTRLNIRLCDVYIVAVELGLNAIGRPVMIVAPVAVYARYVGGVVGIKPGKVAGELDHGVRVCELAMDSLLASNCAQLSCYGPGRCFIFGALETEL